jgi:hypothetical protein
VTIVEALRPYVKRSRGLLGVEAERCEICSTPIAKRHAHVFRRAPRAVLCACGGCAALFRDPAASGSRMRTVPERVLSEARALMTDAHWIALGVPVGLAFFVVDSLGGRCTGYCPSPAGVVEMDVDAAAWEAVATHLPMVRAMEADVEALLVYRPRGGDAEVLVVPLDSCYALAGAVRAHWRGLDGGDDATHAIERALRALRARSRPLAALLAE